LNKSIEEVRNDNMILIEKEDCDLYYISMTVYYKAAWYCIQKNLSPKTEPPFGAPNVFGFIALQDEI
jgi:hypothetical protein